MENVKVGDIIEVTDDRGSELIEKGIVKKATLISKKK